MYRHPTTAKRVDPDMFRATMPASSEQLAAALRAHQHSAFYRHCGPLMMYMGYPDEEYNGGFDSEWYIIFPVLDTGSWDTFGIGVVAQCWDYYDGAGLIDAEWNGTPVGSSVSMAASNAQYQDQSRPPQGLIRYDHKYVSNATGAFGGRWGYIRYALPHACVSVLHAFALPSNTEALQTYSITDQHSLSDAQFAIDVPLRGEDEVGDNLGSVGTLLQNSATVSDLRLTTLSSTARCLFQWGHPTGLHLAVSAAGYLNIFNAQVEEAYNADFTVRVKGRDIFGGNTVLSLAFLALWDTGAKLKLTSSVDTYEYTFTGAQTSTLTPCFALDCLDFDPAGDNIKIEVYLPDDESAVVLRTISLWECAIQ